MKIIDLSHNHCTKKLSYKWIKQIKSNVSWKMVTNNAFGLTVLWSIIYISYGSSVTIPTTTPKMNILNIIRLYLPKSCQIFILHSEFCGTPFWVNGCIRVVCKILLFENLSPTYYMFCFTKHNAKSLKLPCERILNGQNI